jgi:cell division protein FtsI (penicillin-binding protein 3)
MPIAQKTSPLPPSPYRGAAGISFAIFLAASALISTMALAPAAEAPLPGLAVTALTGRADITDRKGVVLAHSVATFSLFAQPRMIEDSAGTAATLCRILADCNEEDLKVRLTSSRNFVWIKRHLTAAEKAGIVELRLRGLGFSSGALRLYSQGRLTSHVLGFTDIDGTGIAGVESSLNSALSSGMIAEKLSLDVNIQDAAHTALTQTIDDFHARGGAGIVLDIQTGQILALVSLPDFDPSDRATMPPSAISRPEAMFNRATSGSYETGGLFRVFTTALALDGGAAIDTRFDVGQPLRIGKFFVRDPKPLCCALTISEIFTTGSNVGLAKMALSNGAVAQKNFLDRLGLLRRPHLEVSEVGTPVVPRAWSDITAMTVAFGMGLAVTPIQLASAIGAIVNDGIYHPATLLASNEQPSGTRVVSASTSEVIVRLMAQNPTGGFGTGGVSGMAEKLSLHGYRKNDFLSSFVAVFPADKPRYLVLTMVDEPHASRQRSIGPATNAAADAAQRMIPPIVTALDLQLPIKSQRRAKLEAH